MTEARSYSRHLVTEARGQRDAAMNRNESTKHDSKQDLSAAIHLVTEALSRSRHLVTEVRDQREIATRHANIARCRSIPRLHIGPIGPAHLFLQSAEMIRVNAKA